MYRQISELNALLNKTQQDLNKQHSWWIHYSLGHNTPACKTYLTKTNAERVD